MWVYWPVKVLSNTEACDPSFNTVTTCPGDFLVQVTAVAGPPVEIQVSTEFKYVIGFEMAMLPIHKRNMLPTADKSGFPSQSYLQSHTVPHRLSLFQYHLHH